MTRTTTHQHKDYELLKNIRHKLEVDLQKEIEKLHLRRMLASYRTMSTAKVATTKPEKHKEHGKTQPILPEVGQFVVDQKSGKKYYRGRLMGKGGFARCYEVTDSQTEKKFACKAVSKARIAKPHQQQKIANEVELHKAFNGRYIVRFYSYFEDEENVYILLELCTRKSMVQLLKQRRTLTEPEVRYFMHQVVQGVSYLHKEKIIHRDIKLGNLFINNDMEIRIGDFGLAVRADKDGKKETSVCGTPNYIAPEVLSKTGHSFEVDTWALGCVMYTLLVGRPPFETSCLKDTYMRIRNNEYAIPSRVTRPAAKLIQKLLSERPEDRPCLDRVLNDEFFTRGFFPRTLPSICCVAPPKFTSMKNRNSKCNTNHTNLNNSVKKTDDNLNTVKDALSKINIQERTDEEQHESGIDSQESNGNDDDCGLHEGVHDVTYSYTNPQTMCERLSKCLNSLPDCHNTECSDPISTGTSDSEEETSLNDGPPEANRLWITKWVDYSNKYGFGAQLSNGCIVIRYNDGTTLAVDANKRRLQYFDEEKNIFRFSVNNIPEDLSRKVTLLNYFANYMDKHLLKIIFNSLYIFAAYSDCHPNQIFLSHSLFHFIQILRHRTIIKIEGGDLDDPSKKNDVFSEMSVIDIWFRTDKAMVMYLSDGTLQVNFLADHTKIILNPELNHDVITYINQSRESYVTSLRNVTKRGCGEEINERLQYCLMVLHKLAEMYIDDGVN